MNFRWHHFNYHVTDTERSVKFYSEVLGMKVMREFDMVSPQGPSHFVFMGYEGSDIALELKRDLEHEGKGPYELGDQSYHFCVAVDDFENALKKFQEMGIVDCMVGDNVGCFIKDPDGYLIEVLSLF